MVVDPRTQLYSLGPGVVDLAWVVLRQQDLRTICRPYLERLRQTTNETVSLYTQVGDKRTCIEELASEQNIKYTQTAGLTVALHVGAPGKVLLAFLLPQELEALLVDLPLSACTSNTLTDREQLRTELAVTRMRGFAISSGERSSGASAIAAPIWDRSSRPIAAVSILGPEQRLTFGKLQELGPQVMRVAQEISVALGYEPNPPRTPPPTRVTSQAELHTPGDAANLQLQKAPGHSAGAGHVALGRSPGRCPRR